MNGATACVRVDNDQAIVSGAAAFLREALSAVNFEKVRLQGARRDEYWSPIWKAKLFNNSEQIS